MKGLIAYVVAVIAFCAAFSAAQDKPADKPTPTLTTEQRGTLENLELRVQRNQLQTALLQAQLVILQREAKDLEQEQTKMVAALQRPGYRFDPERRLYIPSAEEKPKAEATKKEP